MLLADFYTDRGPGGRYTSNANEAIYAVNCVDRPQQPDVEQVRADAAEVAAGRAVVRAVHRVEPLPCAVWPAPAQGEPARVAATGSKPILVVGTTRDPATPYEWAQALADAAGRRSPADLRRRRPPAYRRGNECIDSAVDAYLLDGTTPAGGHSVPLSPARPDAVDFLAVPRRPVAAHAALAQSARATHS